MGNGSVCEQDGRYREIYPELGVGDNAGRGPEGETYSNTPYPLPSPQVTFENGIALKTLSLF